MVQPLYTCFGDVYSSKLIWDEYKAYGFFFLASQDIRAFNAISFSSSE